MNRDCFGNKFGLLLIILLTGCASRAQHFNEIATGFGFKTSTMQTSQFKHQLYINNAVNNLFAGNTLHIYLDGDGMPWERNRWISDDPTSRNPLILRLMALDKLPSILMGRPCYYGLSHTVGCHYKYWTSHRYSKEVINSMATAINSWLRKHRFNQVVLIGYSGGGVIAMLMAEKIQNMKEIVTIAANLDVKAWSKYHGYAPLTKSLNPAVAPKVSEKVKQLHFSGADDEVVPAFIIKQYAANQKNVQYYEYTEQDHACCWEDEWAKMLAIINE